MLINWNLLVEKFGMNKATIKFEELALMYVQKTYSEYNWVLTQRTRDGNKDIHLEEYEKNIPINSLDKWAEVKYKQKNTALTKKDMDLTILSGLINGNIELIMFISNGYIPKSLIERSLSAVQLQNIRLSYILGDQLENWLINHPEIYKCIFEEDINPNLKTKNIIEIKNIQLRYFSTNSQYNVNIMTKFNIGERYIIDFFIYSTFETYGKIIDNEYPFLFLVTDNFNKFDRFKISIGLNRISFIVMANNSFKGTIQYKILIDKKEYTYNTKRLFITQNKIIKLAYPQQLDFIEKIYNLITFHESVDSQQIIPIYGKTGMGKTTLLKKTYEQVCTNNDVIYIDFSSPNQYDENHSINYSLLCKLACFISLGNISYHINNSTSEAATYIKEELNRLGFSPIYSELIDGCFNTIMSKRVIKLFVNNIIENGISESRFFYKMIFIIDNIHCLTETETKIFFKLLSFDKKINNNNIFIICATDGKFEYDYPKEKFLSLPNIFELTGLQPHNIITSIKENTICYPKVEDIFVCHEFLKNPLFLKEYIYQMQIARNDIELNKLVYYSHPLYSTESIMRFEGYNYLLDIIFSLNNGIKKSYLVDYYVKTNKKSKKMIDKDINFLRKNHIISIENNIIFSYHDYIRNLYIKTKNKNIYKNSYSDFYKYVYQFCSQDKLLNDYEILSLIFLTNKKQYTFYKNELIRIFKYYINKTQYGAAYEIGNILYNHIINKRKKTQEECNILYLYTDCMNHCSSSKDDVMNTLKEIRSKSSNNLLLKIEIQASMHNEKFWKLDIDNSIFNDSHNLEIEINNFLRINKRKDIEKRLKRALYTCINRWMVSLLSIDNYSSSLEMLNKGLEYLGDCDKDKLKSEEATYYMDYARGISYHHSKEASNYLKKALKGYNTNKQEHFRRIIICKLDLEIMKSVRSQDVDFSIIDNQIELLKKHSFTSEYFKAILKKYACNLVLLSSDKLCISKDDLIKYNKQLKMDMLNIHYTKGNRDIFLYNQIFACLINIDNKEKYFDLLKNNQKIIDNLGESYKRINEHNIQNIVFIEKIKWAKEGDVLEKNTYYLDPRFW